MQGCECDELCGVPLERRVSAHQRWGVCRHASGAQCRPWWLGLASSMYYYACVARDISEEEMYLYCVRSERKTAPQVATTWLLTLLSG